MISMKVVFMADKVRRELRDIQRTDIPAAKASAFSRVGQSVVSASATVVASRAKVAKWQIMGIGGARKSKGGRLARTKYIKKIDGVLIHFRSGHLNPTGLGSGAKLVKTGTYKRGSRRGSVRAGKRVYRNAFVMQGRFAAPVVMTRTGGGLKPAQIKLGRQYELMVKRKAATVGPRVFAKRFDHEINRRLKRRGAR